ncbi:8-amino-7-oxononanoate synthase [Spirillospora sp. NPDC048911]|uniref:8-amino-7-oxononanoate synthase n=1 Tax=Spirillospora sp. NPDC048911 TaxID=3364527 RepID=UPI0037183409
MTDPLARFRAAARRRDEAGLRRRLRPRTADHDGLIDLASNDYLGLSRDPRLVEGAVAAAREWGTGSTGSRLVTGTTELHAELDRRLAAFTGSPAGLTFSSGYLANLGAVAGLSGAGTLVVSDQVNHASIVDACRLSRARVTITPHRDVAAVERALAERDEEHALVVTDAVFSVDGDLAPLTALHAAARAHGALLVIDEAHALGIVGDEGRGAAHAAGLAAEPDVVLTLTLSKSLAAQGGAVLADPVLIDTLVDTGRAFIFDTGLTPPAAGAALAALDAIEADPGLPARARAVALRMAEIATDLNLETATPAAAVVPVFLGEPQIALRAAEICAEHGARVGCFRPPSVPKGRACLRLTARASVTESDLTTLRTALTAVSGSTGRSLHT